MVKEYLDNDWIIRKIVLLNGSNGSSADFGGWMFVLLDKGF